MRHASTRSPWILVALLCASPLSAADWPTWRHDPARSAAGSEALPDRLELAWTVEMPTPRMAWPNESRLHFDRSYEPIVVGDLLVVGSMVDGSVQALDLATGRARWRFYSEGPVRLAPVADGRRLYFGSDDGHLYCLQTEDGRLLWKVRGAPDERPARRHLGNNRLVSFWPVRGGPVLADGTVYFAAGIWPTMGVFVLAVDAQSGRVVWRNDRLGLIDRVRLDHNDLRQSGLSPQGYLVVQGDTLLVPNGRSMPAGLDRKTGELLYYVQGYRNGDCRVVAAGKYALVGDAGAIHADNGREVGSRWADAGSEAPDAFDGAKFHLFEGPIHPYKFTPGCSAWSAVSDEVVFGLDRGVFYAYDLARTGVSEYESKQGERILKPWRWDIPELWRLPTEDAPKKPAGTALIRAGGRLYGHTGSHLIAVDIAGDAGEQPTTAWSEPLTETVTTMLAANGHLVLTTTDGRLLAFGAPVAVKPSVVEELRPTPAALPQSWKNRAADILRRTGVAEGYCAVLGIGSGQLLRAILEESKLKVIGIDPNSAVVDPLREQFTAAGMYGERVELFVGDPLQFSLPSHMASLLISETLDAGTLAAGRRAKDWYRVLRPYGGTACLKLPAEEADNVESRWRAAELENAVIRRQDDSLLVSRDGPLPGAANWTHECGDASRSFYSDDGRVAAPLGVLWYGDGPGYGFWKHKDYGIGVKPQVVGGRLFALQISSSTLYAYDVYTGRVLWSRKVEPFTRYVSQEDGVYVAGGNRCEVLDTATGEPRAGFSFQCEGVPTPFVADVRIAGDVVLIALAPEKVRVIEKGLWDSSHLVALDRSTGTTLWRRKAAQRFNNNGLSMGRGLVFAVDSRSAIESQQDSRRGELSKELPSTILAIDARSGEVRWSRVTTNPYRTYGIGNWLGIRGNDDWVAYCREADLLLAGKSGRAYAFAAADGKPIWQRPTGAAPWILRGDTFIHQGGGVCRIDNGEPVGEAFAIQRGGCNYAVASKHLLLVRERSISYFDSESRQKQSLFAVRSGCSNSLVAADGVLSVPNFAVGCICNYPVQTSLAMILMPEATAWLPRESTAQE
ncbi:MAG: PQQ-binding-like beta-propeller repeat protein [Rhodopirellula sp.]|nr:PQQ-binding-like beta-propeller repeat protein [Rhodopirellula sp.]